MELTSDFTVDAPLDRAWAVLNDVERVALCIPGASLEEVVGEEYRGTVRVKVGPITAEYKGVATFLERDQEHHRIVLKAEGRETCGQGNASATITATLNEVDGKTAASIVTDLSITGRVAEFGRGVLADVSGKLMGQFAESLEADLQRDNSDEGENGAETSTEGVATPLSRDGVNGQPQGEESLNLLSVVGGSLARRLAVPLGGLAALVLAYTFLRRGRRSSR